MPRPFPFEKQGRCFAFRSLSGSGGQAGIIRIDIRQSFAMINGDDRGITAGFKRKIRK
jgi:hypothetical protein